MIYYYYYYIYWNIYCIMNSPSVKMLLIVMYAIAFFYLNSFILQVISYCMQVCSEVLFCVLSTLSLWQKFYHPKLAPVQLFMSFSCPVYVTVPIVIRNWNWKIWYLPSWNIYQKLTSISVSVSSALDGQSWRLVDVVHECLCVFMNA